MPRRKQKYIDAERAQAAAAAPKSVPTPQPTPDWPRYMTLKQAAKYLGHRSHFIVYRWVQAGKLSVNTTTKAWTVDRFDLDQLWREGAETAA